MLCIQEEHSEENITEEMLGAASTLIREWAESVLGLKFGNLSALARHLVDHFCVDTRSLAAVCILSAAVESNASSNKGKAEFSRISFAERFNCMHYYVCNYYNCFI